MSQDLPTTATRVAEVLSASAAPMTAIAILKVLKTDAAHLNKKDINAAIYGAPAAYGSVENSTPPLWFVRGAAADPRTKGIQSAAPYERLEGIPPPDGVPDGEFKQGTVVLCGEASDPSVITGVVDLLVRKGAGRLRCLTGQPAGETAVALLRTDIETDPIGYAGEGKYLRRGVAAGHKTAMGAPDTPVALCIVGPPTTSCYSVHHILAAFEAHGLPVYLTR